MNVKDFLEKYHDLKDVTLEDFISLLFDRQSELMYKYRDIEGFPSIPLVIQTREGQKVIKDFLWRVTEELAEAAEVFIGKEEVDRSSEDFIHLFEEVIDGLHFITELTLLCGYTKEEIVSYLSNRGTMASFYTASRSPNVISGYYMQWAWDVVVSLGMLGNTCKNKPWKQTHVPTDEAKFKELLFDGFHRYMKLLGFLGDFSLCIQYYLSKADVNTFRIRSQY